jgi:hypothetical protein
VHQGSFSAPVILRRKARLSQKKEAARSNLAADRVDVKKNEMFLILTWFQPGDQRVAWKSGNRFNGLLFSG